MTIQEEILEETAIRFALEKHGGTRETLYPHWIAQGKTEALDLFAYYHSKGMVIKVERELPKAFCSYRGRHMSFVQCGDCWRSFRHEIKDSISVLNRNQCSNKHRYIDGEEMLQAGYAAVEPLIEEK